MLTKFLSSGQHNKLQAVLRQVMFMTSLVYAAPQLLCLDVHPSRPTLAATGSSGGTVAIWDLRFHTAPLALTGPRPTAGDVNQVGAQDPTAHTHRALRT